MMGSVEDEKSSILLPNCGSDPWPSLAEEAIRISAPKIGKDISFVCKLACSHSQQGWIFASLIMRLKRH
jgi:hypothetical protein